MKFSLPGEFLAERAYHRKNCSVQSIITGVGMLNTAYGLTKKIAANKPDLAIQAGIAGTMHPFYPPGMVTVIKEEILGDWGVEENGLFQGCF